ncbi:MAG: TlpA family protein disulfide reductase [Janthinobacterium lividum]
MLKPWPQSLAAPHLQLVDRAGRTWDLRDLRGKVVILNFWASWCVPCVDELHVFNELVQEAPASAGKLVILGVNFKESSATIEQFVEQHPFAYPILVDKTGETFKAWTSGVMPTTILIDASGQPAWRLVGELDPDAAGLRQTLQRMLAQAVAGKSVSGMRK